MRYHFDVASPHGLALDGEGRAFTSFAEALKEALCDARELASERVLLGEPLHLWTIIVRNECEEVVQELKLSDLVNGSTHWFGG